MSLIQEPVEGFRAAAEEWICQLGSVEYRYVAENSGYREHRIVHASVSFHPWVDQDPEPFEFHLQVDELLIGQRVITNCPRTEALSVLADALEGRIRTQREEMVIAAHVSALHYRREQSASEWANQLRLTVSGLNQANVTVSPALDDELRRAEVPFDGYNDLIQWLGLPDFRLPGIYRSIAISVGPPALIVLDQSELNGGKLSLTLDAQTSLREKDLGIALIGYPPNGVKNRRRVEGEIVWNPLTPVKKRGSLTIEATGVDTAFLALSIGKTYVQRHWFVDPARSKNIRYIAAHQFDQGLRKLQAGLVTTDSRSFERAVASLLFIGGFSPFMPLESDAPDLVVTTPSGQICIVECTLKTTDARAKIGNLVARREGLRATLQQGGHTVPLLSALICQSPRNQIVLTDEHMAEHDVLLVTREDLDRYLLAIRNPAAPDELFVKGLERLKILKSKVAGAGGDLL